jgi:feruloyl esterase
MIKAALLAVLGLIIVIGAGPSAQAGESRDAQRCQELSRLQIPDAKVVGTFLISGDVGLDTSKRKLSGTACRVVVESSLSTGSAIKHEIWLPIDNWNGRFLGLGNGGWGGVIKYSVPDGANDMALIEGVNRNFATANTDMGAAGIFDSSNASAIPVKWLDYGQRATHDMTRVAKIVIARFYGRPPEHSYFRGCSTGGFQALRNAQFFPDDYDGIISGHAGNERARKIVAIIRNYMLPKLHPEGILPNDKLLLMHRAVLKACAGKGGGLASDPFVTVPQSCQWKPETLVCRGKAGKNCLSEAQVDLANRLYSPMTLKSSGEEIFPGLPRGTELDWEDFMKSAKDVDPPHAAVIRTIMGAQYDFRKNDWDRDVETYLRIQGPLWADGPNADLSRFRARGGKLIAHFGLNDMSSFYDFANYYRSVERAVGKTDGVGDEQAAADLRTFFRLFTMPGVEHCGGGNGPNTFDALAPLMDWVEKGQAPDRIDAYWTDQHPGSFATSLGEPMSRPLCPYPQVALYTGSGDPKAANNFVCGAPRLSSSGP